jgi:hypothetical protein
VAPLPSNESLRQLTRGNGHCLWRQSRILLDRLEEITECLSDKGCQAALR